MTGPSSWALQVRMQAGVHDDITVKSRTQVKRATAVHGPQSHSRSPVYASITPRHSTLATRSANLPLHLALLPPTEATGMKKIATSSRCGPPALGQSHPTILCGPRPQTQSRPQSFVSRHWPYHSPQSFQVRRPATEHTSLCFSASRPSSSATSLRSSASMPSSSTTSLSSINASLSVTCTSLDCGCRASTSPAGSLRPPHQSCLPQMLQLLCASVPCWCPCDRSIIPSVVPPVYPECVVCPTNNHYLLCRLPHRHPLHFRAHRLCSDQCQAPRLIFN